MNLTRENINSKVNEIDSKIKNFENELDKIKYATGDHSFDCFGTVSDMELPEVVAAMAKLKENKSNCDDACKELGISLEDFGEDADFEYKGFTYDEWVNDFKTRVKEIKLTEKIDKLVDARTILFRNLSEDDIFNREMAEAGDILNGLLDD
jgi:hypothetical protein